jgi:hypothetical protein
MRRGQVMPQLAMAAALLSGCLSTSTFQRPPTFGEQGAVVSPHDEPGGRFDGARVSPGFGVLYLHGYTNEAVDQPACGGYFAEEPEHVLEVTHHVHLKLVINAEPGLVMGVKGPDGTLQCADEPGPMNANVALTADFDPGRYEVWVGEHQRHTSAGYRLVLSE